MLAFESFIDCKVENVIALAKEAADWQLLFMHFNEKPKLLTF